MALLDNLKAILQTWPEWRAMQATPATIAALEKRVVELEQRLARCPGAACDRCGALAMRVQRHAPTEVLALMHAGGRDYYRRCEQCGYEDVQTKSMVA